LHYYLLSALSIVFFIFGSVSFSSELPEMEEILITSGRAERTLDATAAETTVITGDDIAKMHISTIPELLNTISGINLAERGTPGSQADISIRGSSFEGVLVLINGIRAHDPQTGHFAMDIPVNLSTVEKVEVMAGGGSSIYGASASGGVINIVTKNASNEVRGTTGFGTFGSRKADISFSRGKSEKNFFLGLHGGRSDGYMPGTDLDNMGINAGGSFSSKALMVRWNGGYMNKRFGAANFYAPYQSFEKTATFQGGINAGYMMSDKRMVRFRIGSRGHGDDFILIRNRPEFYRNTHYNRSYSLAAEYLANPHEMLSITAGVESERMGITSPGLGNHSDYNHAMYGQLTSRIKKSLISFSMRFDTNSRKESIVSPGIGITVPFDDNKRFRFRTEKSFRSPTYTELYYNSPSNYGNPSLKSQHSLSMEAGFDIIKNKSIFGLTGFARRSTNIIDWVRYPEGITWFAANHGRLLTAGIEMKYNISIWQSWNIRINSSLLRQNVSNTKGSESKYILNPVERSVVAVFSGPVFAGFKGTFFTRYEKLQLGRSRSPVAVRISRQFNDMKMKLSFSNLFNEKYEELPGLKAPGRWLNLEVEYCI
jgi:vitamin B12 transporter